MPIRDKEKRNAYFKDYMKRRWQLRRESAIIKLGGECVKCGCTEDLEFDHIDPKTKFKAIAKISSYSDKLFNAELEKCQLLCTSCHKDKHAPLAELV